MNNEITHGVARKSQGLLWSAEGSCLQQINVHNGRAGKASAYVGPLDRGPPEGCSWALMPPSCGKPREGPSPHATAGGVAGREVALRRRPSAHPELRSRKETQCLPRMEMQEGVGSPARGECRVTSQPEEVSGVSNTDSAGSNFTS